MLGCSSLAARRWIIRLASLCFVLAVAGSAWGWTEKEIESSAITIDVASSGLATIHYSLTLAVRGSRLKGLTLEGVDLDASPLPDATITRLRNGRATSLPLPVDVVANGGKLEITIPLSKGFAGRHFKLDFGYRTDLFQQENIRTSSSPGRSEITWTSPRYPNGVDAASVLFRFPAHRTAPTVGSSPDGVTFGIVMSNLRRSEVHDELELIRAHLAQGESMIWRAQVGQGLFPAAAGAPVPVTTKLPFAAVTSASVDSRQISRDGILLSLVGILYALLVALKSRYVVVACRQHDCTARGLVPLRSAWRALGAGILLWGAIALTLWTDHSAAASCLLLGCLACAAHWPPLHPSALRGSGDWRSVDASELNPLAATPIVGSWLDASRRSGLCFLFLALGISATAASHWYGSSPYLGASALCGSSIFLPIFCSGLARDLPRQRLVEARSLLSKVYRQLENDQPLMVTVLGRFTRADQQLEELRLSVMLQTGITGLKSLEVAVELHDDWTGGQAMPVVLIRAADSSPCYRALPRDLSWTRGRTEDERAAIVRPQWPTAQLAVELVREVSYLLQRPSTDNSRGTASSTSASQPGMPTTADQRSQKARRSSGRALSAAKADNRASPAHAT